MPQVNDANLVRVYTRSDGGTIEELDPVVTAGFNRFEVIVEAEAGAARENNGSPYTITLTALDITGGQSAANLAAAFNPAPLNQTFSSAAANFPAVGGAINITPWSAYEEKFVIQLTAGQASNAAGHVLQYTAVLQATGSDPIVSIAQSPPFILV